MHVTVPRRSAPLLLVSVAAAALAFLVVALLVVALLIVIVAPLRAPLRVRASALGRVTRYCPSAMVRRSGRS